MLTFYSIANASGTDIFTLWLIDSGAFTDSVSITITINPVNDNPVILTPATIQGNSTWTKNEDFGSFNFYLSDYESDHESSTTDLDWFVTGKTIGNRLENTQIMMCSHSIP